MNEIHLKASGGKIIATLPAYESLYQVPLSRYIDFLKAREPLDIFLAELEKIKDEDEKRKRIEQSTLNMPRILAQSVAGFVGVPLDEILRSEFGDYEQDGDVKNGVVMMRLSSLNQWIINLLGTFSPKIRKPEDCTFDYKGDKYTIPVIGMQALASLPLLPDLETGEMIEAYEIKRLSQAKIEKDDPEGSHLFSYHLRLFAVLCRKEYLSDEDKSKKWFTSELGAYLKKSHEMGLKDGKVVDMLPVGESNVEEYINERSLHFRDIDAGTALDVDFFLAGMMRPSAQTGAAVGFLSNRVFALVQAHAKRSGLKRKRSTGQWSVQKRSLRKLAGGKPTSSSSKGRGSKKKGKARLNQ